MNLTLKCQPTGQQETLRDAIQRREQNVQFAEGMTGTQETTYHPYNLLELNELCTLDKYFYKINYSSHKKSIYKIKLS